MNSQHVRVSSMRLAFVWMELPSGLLTNAQPAGGPPSLSDRRSYLQAYEDARDQRGAMRLPWWFRDDGGHRFWKFYLRRKAAEDRSPDLGWRRIVPLLADTRPGPYECDGFDDVELVVETFLYPHATSTVGMLDLTGERSLDEAVDMLIDARRTRRYRPRGDAAAGAAPLWTVLQNACRAASLARGGTVGPIDAAFDLFSLAVVLRGSEVAPGEIVPNSPIHRALHGCCTFDATWRDDQPDPLAAARLRTTAGSTGAALYARRTARMLWYPERFGPRRKQAHFDSLRCYHRNLTFAAMQTQSLLALARWGLDRVSHPEPDFEVWDLVKNCASVLGLLYGKAAGVRDVYASRSVRRQIADSGLIPTINLLRRQVGVDWEALEPDPPGPVDSRPPN